MFNLLMNWQLIGVNHIFGGDSGLWALRGTSLAILLRHSFNHVALKIISVYPDDSISNNLCQCDFYRNGN
ncbi:hypothetical protein Lmor_0559 [Legionella moravica]|uniref:Uncharacterized protein n=1 Tax=Legionella moravica TaxID=39962 RepID=A0ABR5RFC9_9GAMM|nr:hypothetical protein Lmor_0559 [Legionella moravica]